MWDEYDYYYDESDRPPDPVELQAEAALRAFFEAHQQEVFYSRQLEVRFEDQYFHWITNRALRTLVKDGELLVDRRVLITGELHVVRHPRCRYHTRATTALAELVQSYSEPLVTRAVGDQGEMLVLEGFARRGFTMYGRDMRAYRGREWSETGHDLDFIFERGERAYGVEVKNTLPYIPYPEFKTKIRMCQHLGITPVFMCRFLPKLGFGKYGKQVGSASF